MNILGINAAYHENSAALIVDGQVRCAVEEERFNRIKHGSEARIDNPHELPIESIRYCLAEGNLQSQDIDAVSFSFDPEIRKGGWVQDPYALDNDWGNPVGEDIFYHGLLKVPNKVSELLQTDISRKFHYVSHHIAHAASTYYPSTFDPAAILVVDGIGEDATALLAYGNGSRIETLERILFPNSLGFLWEKFSKFLGFSEYDAAKVMGLSGYGNPETYRAAFEQIVAYEGQGSFTIHNDIVQFRKPDFEELETLFGTVDRSGEPGHNQKACDIAATLQEVTNNIMLGLANYLHQQHPCNALCLAGGVALNCQTNWIIKEQGPYQHLYIPTAPHDGGTAIGAALHTYYNQFIALGHTSSYSHNTKDIMTTPYSGPRYQDAEILSCLRAQDRDFQKSDNVAVEAARMIADGKIVAWFQGSMELGPRALGNRSLLADPRDPNVREILNRKVKHREIFRPFAPSVLEEHSADWFEMGKFSESYRYMLYACPVRPDKLDRIPAVIHIDNTARVQTVHKDVNPRYHELISHFHMLTGVPLVLNTSFNDSEPIVCSPQDALNTFNKTRIDVLILGDYIIERHDVGPNIVL